LKKWKEKIRYLISKHFSISLVILISVLIVLFIVYEYASLYKLLTLTKENKPQALIGSMQNPIDNFTSLPAIAAILQLILAFSIATLLISIHIAYKFLKEKKDIIFKNKRTVGILKFLTFFLTATSFLLTTAYGTPNFLLITTVFLLLGSSLTIVLLIKNRKRKPKTYNLLMPQKPTSRVNFFFKVLALTIPIYLIILTLTYRSLSVKVVNAYNPAALHAKDKYPFQSYEVSNAKAYEYLSRIKHDFKVGDQETAQTAFQKRLKSGKKPIIYVIDGFHGADPTMAYIYGIVPIPTVIYHGDIVEKIIESILHDEIKKKLVTIKKVSLQSLISETKNIYLFDPFKDPLIETLTRIEKENPDIPVFINMSFGRNYFLPIADQKIKKFIELNNKGFILVKSAGNKKEHTITSLGVTEALGFLLENFYTVGDAKRFQPGEVNIDGIAKVVFDNGAKTTLKGTSFSSPAYLALFVKRLFFTGYLSDNGNGQHLCSPHDSSTKPQ